MNKRILFLYPNTANKPAITMSIPILAGIAKNLEWEMHYFDTTFYKRDQDSIEDKEKTGGFLPVKGEKRKKEIRTHNQLVDDLQNTIDNVKPDILCITAMSCEFEYLMTFFPEINIPEKTKVIIGGVHSILLPEEAISTGLFDLACIEQGEEVFARILIRMECSRNLDGIKGTYFKNKKTGNVIKYKRNRLLNPHDLWAISPDYSLYEDEYFVHPFDGKMVRMFWMEVSRGCPWRCTYCGNSALKQCYKGLGRYIHNRPLDSIFKNFKVAVEELNIDIFNFTAECFLYQRNEWLEEFADRYSKEVGKPFLIQTRPETIGERTLGILQAFQVPFFQVGMGVESGSDRILNDICKRQVNINDTIRAYDLLDKYGIRSNAYFMIGFPTETREEIFETIELCRRVNSHINCVSIFQPLPGVPLTKTCIEKGYMTGDEPLETFTNASVLNMPQITSEEISSLRRVFLLYAKLPKEYYGDIERCEYDYENNKKLFEHLLSLRWKYDKKWKR